VEMAGIEPASEGFNYSISTSLVACFVSQFEAHATRLSSNRYPLEPESSSFTLTVDFRVAPLH